MRSVRLHFILGYGVIGAISPFLPEFLRTDRGLSAGRIGMVFAAIQLSIMISPAVLTALADRGVKPKVIGGGIFLIIAVALLALWLTSGFAVTLLLFALYGFAFSALFPAQDGYFFALQRHREAQGRSTPPYHRIRVLGTIGFIIPSGVLLLLGGPGDSLTVILPVAIGFAVLAILNAAALPDAPVSPAGGGDRPRLPTAEAARALFSRPTIALCVAMALMQVNNSAYYTFYPIRLVESLGVEARWLGAISTLGVAVEAVMMLGFGWFTVRVGVRRMVVIGMLMAGLRLVILAVSPDATPAILANLLHGPIILGTLVAPVVFINRLAGDSFRNSMQGVFTVAVIGPARLVGNLSCGWLAAVDTRLAFVVGAALALVASALIAWFVADPPAERAA